MLVASILAVLGVIGFAVVIFGLVARRKSSTIGAIAVAMALLEGFGAIGAWRGSQPLAVIAMFCVVAAISLIVAVKHFSQSAQ